MVAKQQYNFRLDPELVEALRARAEEDGMTLTDLFTRLGEQYLGLPPSVTIDRDFETLYERISERIAEEIDQRLEPVILKLMEVEEALGE